MEMLSPFFYFVSMNVRCRQLFDVLTHPVVAGRRLPILLACNKADLGSKAHTTQFIRKILEREIDAMRSTRRSLAGDEAGTTDVLGPPGESFSFQTPSGRSRSPVVTFASVSAVDSGGVKDVETFIRRCIPA